MSTAGIIVIGNEVLSGKVEERNASYMSRELRALGVDLRRIAVIPDEIPLIADEVRRQAPAVRYVFTAGGVGSTHDDVTFEGVAAGLGVPIERHAELESLIRGHYKERTNDSLLRMAEVPRGTTLMGVGVLPFPIARAGNVFILPGVPEFLRAKFEFLKPLLRTDPFVLKQIFVRVGEDRISELMRDAQAEIPGVMIGSYPRFDTDEYKVKITIEARDPEIVAQGLNRLLNGLPPDSVVRVE